MRIDYDLIEKINDEIYDNDDYYNEEYYQVLCKKAKNLQQYISILFHFCYFFHKRALLSLIH